MDKNIVIIELFRSNFMAGGWKGSISVIVVV